jgi:glucose/arabinose dehydrogenase
VAPADGRPRPLTAWPAAARALLAALVVGGWLSQAVGAAAASPDFVLETLWTGLPPVSGLAHAGDERLFVALLDGRILVYENGRMREQAFLDLRGLVNDGGERGLLGLAFHPAFAANGVFFVAYTDPRYHLIVARYRTFAGGEEVDTAAAVTLLDIEGWSAAHFAGQLQFGPDGYLYVAVGVGPWYGDGQCNGQRLDRLLGKLLRLDVDAGAAAPPYYSIPPSNPFAGGAAPEVWAYGLRNPWRFSFDRSTGDLYLGDVGENEREEIDLQPAASPGGENYGWARQEGTYCIDLVAPCLDDPVPPCGDPALTPPILEHDHDRDGFCAVIGGHVYRGSEIPELEGRYLYGDHCSGRLFAARREATGWSSQELAIGLPKLSSIAEDARGESYLTTTTGVLARLSAWPGRGTAEQCAIDDHRLCLGVGGRYRVAARWIDALGRTGEATAVGLTSDSGYFWFFQPDNVELVVKLLEGCGVGLTANWFFAAGLTDVEVDLRVVDSVSGVVRRYRHPPGSAFRAIQDTTAFPCP